VLKLSRGLSATGQKPKEKIAIFLETRAEWIIAIQVSLFTSIYLILVYSNYAEK